jgi:hypothetical protein
MYEIEKNNSDNFKDVIYGAIIVASIIQGIEMLLATGKKVFNDFKELLELLGLKEA